ncbi:glycosyltransferase [Reinekea sp.]|jgi:glycosyltransferase involved in cell wall biosynthesis|uniref:glycosyltransferase n=1 Tax=Reinekea sp. TaxID=1970455 RepID=UPI003988C7F7
MPTKVVLLIAKNWPEPNSTAAGRRTLDLLNLFKKAGFEVHIASTAEPTPFQADFSALSYATHSIKVNDNAFDDWISAFNPTLVIYDRFVMEEQFGWRVKEQSPKTATLIDTSDLHCLRIAREHAFKKDQTLNLFNDIAIREISAITRCDFTLMISKVEIDLLINKFQIPQHKCLYLPFLVDQAPQPSLVGFADRQNLVMVGGFKHEPNRDATRWLREALWPAMQPLLPKGTQMHVYGAYADHAMNQLNAPKNNFYIKGRVDDSMSTVERYRLNLAPLRFGAGQKGKILEGWLTGTPTLTTPVGAEAMHGAEPPVYKLTNHPDEFARLVASYYQDEMQWLTLQEDGYRRVRSNFLSSDHAPKFVEVIIQAIEQLDAHRAKDFWQSLLWQNQLGSMKYMSRWIEEKNKQN